MCVVSMVTDHYWEKWQTPPVVQPPQWIIDYTPKPNVPTQAELDEFRALLAKARKYDAEHNQPDCELQAKKDRLKALAKDLGFNIDFIEET